MSPKVPFTLAGLAKAGQAAAPGALPEGHEPEVNRDINPDTVSRLAPAPVATPPFAFSDGQGRGFLKIFPPQYSTLAELPAGWVNDNWSNPSPWCRLEGCPDHPDFEANLKAWENS